MRDAVERLRSLCLALPEAVEKETWEQPTFRVRERIFAMVHRVPEGLSVWLKAPEGVQEVLVGADPARFFRPPYVGGRGWVGVHLRDAPEAPLDWAELEALIRRSWAMTAPKRLVRAHAREAEGDPLERKPLEPEAP